jgi:hypothetical protein
MFRPIWPSSEQADKHTREETTKIKKENREKTQMETCRVTTWKKGRKKSSEAESFEHMKIKI